MMMLAMSVKPGSKSPMCQVCNDESSGFHYGVDSCEGCKGFFRRCITQGMTHKCSNEERCEITPFTRNSCQFCRLKKCFAVGMSREASRLGRRPKRLKESGEQSKHHTGNLPIAPYPSAAELHRLRMAELQRLLQANGTFKSELMAAFLSAEQSNFREHASPASHGNTNDMKNCNNVGESGYSSLSSPTKSQSPIQVTATQQINNNNIINNNEVFYDPQQTTGGADNIDPSSPTYGHVTRIKSEPLTPSCGNNNQHIMLDGVNHHQQQEVLGEQNAFIKTEGSTSPAACNIMDDNTTNLDVLLLELQLPVPENRQLLIDKTTSVIIDANLATSRYTYENLYSSELLVNSVRQQSILQEIEDELSMTNTDRDKKTTDEASSLWQIFIANMVPEITEVVKFCKKLPGFSEIEQEDQIKLLKQGTFEVMLTRYCILVDTKNHEMFDPDMKMKYKREVVRAMPLGHFFEEFFNIADQVNPLNLTNDEIGLFTAMLMMSPQRMGIKNQKAIGKIQELYQQALLLHMKKSHADYEDIFKRLLYCIPTLRAVNQKHASALNNLKMSMPTKDMFPPLHTELCE